MLLEEVEDIEVGLVFSEYFFYWDTTTEEQKGAANFAETLGKTNLLKLVLFGCAVVDATRSGLLLLEVSFLIFFDAIWSRRLRVIGTICLTNVLSYINYYC